MNANGTNEMRLFEELRLHPWVPRQKSLIDGILARMEIEAPSVAAEYRARYDAKLAEHEGPKEETKVEEVMKEEPKADEPKVEEKKKEESSEKEEPKPEAPKKGRRKKSSPSA